LLSSSLASMLVTIARTLSVTKLEATTSLTTAFGVLEARAHLHVAARRALHVAGRPERADHGLHVDVGHLGVARARLELEPLPVGAPREPARTRAQAGVEHLARPHRVGAAGALDLVDHDRVGPDEVLLLAAHHERWRSGAPRCPRRCALTRCRRPTV
jgi:hypothetical protein